MSINSLSLIVHTTLLNSLMPPSVFYVFKRYLNLVRLNSPGFNEHIEEEYSVHDFTSEVGYSNYLKSSDYVHLFARNLVIIMIALLIIALVWIAFAITDYLSLKKKTIKLQRYSFFHRKNEPFMNNFALRFFYEIFLEVCICSTINLALANFDAFSPGFQWILSCITVLGVFVFIGWLISLFFVNGPYINEFYGKGTVLESLNWVRPINPEFYAQNKAEVLRISQQESMRGSMRGSTPRKK